MTETPAATPIAKARDRYFPQLDGLRALAVSTVFIGHLIPLRLLQKIVSWGDTGVLLFFCLSGFLITGILLHAEHVKWDLRLHAFKTFYARRALRIFPIYYLTIALSLLVGYAPVREHLVRLLTYSLNVPGLAPTDRIGAVSHFWSLCIEEQFYLFWPLLVLTVPRAYLRRFIIGLLVFALLYKGSLATVDAPYKLMFVNLLGCMDSLGLGALLALAWHNRVGSPEAAMRPFIRAGMFSALVWILMTIARVHLGIDAEYTGYRSFAVIYFASIIVSSTGLIAFAALGTQGWIGRLLQHPLMVQVGKISYGLYVYHFFTVYILLWMVSHQYLSLPTPWHHAVLSVTLSVCAAVLSWRFIERPLLGLKRHFV